MNILFVTLINIDNLDQRGIYSDLMKCFVDHGHKVTIICPLERRLKSKKLKIEGPGYEIIKYKSLNIQKTNYLEKTISTFLVDSMIKQTVRTNITSTVDLIIYSTPPVTLSKTIAFVKKKFGAKSYLLLKDIFPQCLVDLGVISKFSPFYYFLKRKEKRLYNLSDYIGCMSPANVKYVKAHNKFLENKVVEVCPNSVTPIEHVSVDNKALKIKYEIPSEALVLVYGGNLGKPQAVDFIINILESHLENRSLYFLIVGSGTEYNKLRKWYSHYNPANSKLISYLPKNEYDDLLRIGDIGMIFIDVRYTIPNFPSRLLSYLENNMPVILATDENTDIGTIAVKNDFGLWSITGDLNAFNKNLRIISEMPEKKRIEMGVKGHNFMLNNYTSEISYDIITAHFKK